MCDFPIRPFRVLQVSSSYKRESLRPHSNNTSSISGKDTDRRLDPILSPSHGPPLKHHLLGSGTQTGELGCGPI